MLNAVSGVARVIARTRSSGPDRTATEPTQATARRVHRRAIGAARICADVLTATPRAHRRAAAATRGTADAIASRTLRTLSLGGSRRRLVRQRRLLRFTSDRALPIAIALTVVFAAALSFAPGTPAGALEGAAPAADVRLAVGGGGGNVQALSDFGSGDPGGGQVVDTAAVDDGTLYKPVAVDTSVQTSASMLRHYKVREGDTLTGIASRFGVSMMTVWWANNLTSKDALKVGKTLVIPPVNGLVVTVQAGDTLETLAAEHKITVDEIVAINELEDTNLIVGQVVVLPGAKGDPMPTPKPTPTPRPRTSTSGGGGGGGGIVYVSGAWAWPVAGGYVSQYFHYGHYGVDIAADYGSSIVSPRAGVVVFAGWKSNGGGYQVWINHGSGIYSAHHHMASVSVSAGQSVAKGQRVGRVGSTGWATGPHDHFEVWIGKPWESGSYRVNPLRYY